MDAQIGSLNWPWKAKRRLLTNQMPFEGTDQLQGR